MGGYRTTDPETSRLAYEEMESTGALSRRRLEIASLLAYSKEGILTAGQIARHIKRNRNNVATRLSEMEHLKVVRKATEVVCPVSEKLCWTWELTGEQPSGVVPKGPGNGKTAKLLLLLNEALVALDESGDLFARHKANEIRQRMQP